LARTRAKVRRGGWALKGSNSRPRGKERLNGKPMVKPTRISRTFQRREQNPPAIGRGKYTCKKKKTRDKAYLTIRENFHQKKNTNRRNTCSIRVHAHQGKAENKSGKVQYFSVPCSGQVPTHPRSQNPAMRGERETGNSAVDEHGGWRSGHLRTGGSTSKLGSARAVPRALLGLG